MRKNPFSLSFGRIPPEYIARSTDLDYIITTFTQSPVTDQTFIVTGVRGSGKTVTMTAIGKAIGELDDWTVVKISPMEDILSSLLSILSRHTSISQWCSDAKIEISVPFVKVGIGKYEQPRSIVDSIDRILSVMQKHGQKLLVLIDEITNTVQMKEFSSALQLFITSDRPIYFIGTCLYEALEALRNEKNLTFLYRAPKVRLEPLGTASMANSYQQTFRISKQQALQMARFTKGYSYAFQVLGYYCWRWLCSGVNFPDKKIINDFDVQLADASYNKLWSDLSANDKKVMRIIASNEGGRTKDLYTAVQMDSNSFNQYRRRLKDRGLINTTQYGKISFSLPRMAEYIKQYTMQDDF